jgi:flagellar protein FliS
MLTPFSQYQNTQITTATPEKILIMLYEGAVNFSRIALDRLNRGDIAGKGRYLGKALAIVTELMNTLNHDVGGEISQRLEQLYIYLIEQFTQANINNSTKSLESAIEVLVILRDAWVDAVALQKTEREADQQIATPFVAAR